MFSPQTVNFQPLSIPQSPQVLPSPLFLWATAPASRHASFKTPTSLMSSQSPSPSRLAIPRCPLCGPDLPRSAGSSLSPVSFQPPPRLQTPRSGLDCLSGLLSQRPATEPLSPPCRTKWSHAGTQWGLQSQSSDSVSVQPFHPNRQALLEHFPRKPFLRVTEP